MVRTAILGISVGVALLLLGLMSSVDRPMPLEGGTPEEQLSFFSCASSDVIDWLRSHAVPFRWAEPQQEDGFFDLAFLPEWVGQARLVGLGETTHGTHECFSMKDRLVRFLVQTMGFKLFAIEANVTKAQPLDRYLQTGEGDPEALLHGLGFWTWDTDEVLSMIRWMRSYNERLASHETPIRFLGVDMQDPFAAMDAVAEFIERTTPEAADRILSKYDFYRGFRADLRAYSALSEAKKTQCRASLQAVEAWLLAEGERLSLEPDYHESLMNAQVVRQNELYHADSPCPNIRDHFMAENALAWLGMMEPGAKMVLWAHNYHVARDWPGGVPMGHRLREALGEDYLSLGFTFYDGAFIAFVTRESGDILRLGEAQPALPPPDSYEAAFRAVEVPRFFLDLRTIRGGGSPATDWLDHPQRFRQVGAVFSPEEQESALTRASLPRVFDGLIHFQNTSASRFHVTSISAETVDLAAHSSLRNPGFEEGLEGWELSGTAPEEYVLDQDEHAPFEGTYSARLMSKEDGAGGSGNLKQFVDATAFREGRARLSAWIRTEDVVGSAALWLLVLGPKGIVSLDTMEDRPIRGTTEWTPYVIELDVPEEATLLLFGMSLDGRGTLWVDRVNLEPGEPK